MSQPARVAGAERCSANSPRHPPEGEQASLGVVTRAAGEGPREAGIDGNCESSHEADTRRCNPRLGAKEAEARREADPPMAIRVALLHRSTYRFDRLVNLSPHEIRLRPAPHCRTPVLGYSLSVEPENHFVNWQQDPYGNWLARLVFPERTDKLAITVDLTADMSVTNPFDFFVEPYAEGYPFAYSDALAKELIRFWKRHR